MTEGTQQLAECKEARIEITHIMCIDCLYKIADALKTLDGVIDARHNPQVYPPWVWVKYDPAKVNRAQLEFKIEQTGYRIKGKRYPGIRESLRQAFRRRR